MNYIFTTNQKILAIILMVIGVAAIITGFLIDPHKQWANLLISNFYFMAIALAGTFFVAINYLSQAGWSVVIKRVPEAMAQFLPYAAVFMLIIFFFGGHDIYHWTHSYLYEEGTEHFDPILAGKRSYLNSPFFVIRMVLYFLIWIGFTYLLRRESLREDLNGGLEHYNRSVKYSAVFIVLFAITSSTSAWDFLMSVEAHWFSTLFGWYTFAGLFVSGLAVMVLTTIFLKRNNYLPDVNENHLHDLGKFMFGFSVFWTYLWFSQFMLIWYVNLPEEVTFYINRINNYRVLFGANLIINFITPLLVLMTRDAKRKMRIMTIVAIILFIGHWIDYYLVVMPGVVGSHGAIGFVEIGTLLGFAGLFIFVLLNSLSKAALQPKYHPMLGESIHHHV